MLIKRTSLLRERPKAIVALNNQLRLIGILRASWRLDRVISGGA
jgi:hypothetical protein